MITKSPILQRLTLIILLISFGSILTSGFFIHLALNRQFQDYLTRTEMVRQQQVVKVLAGIYQELGGWDQMPSGMHFGRGMYLGNLRYVTDYQGQVVLVIRHGPNPKPQSSLRTVPIKVGNKVVGTAYFGKTMLQDLLSRQDELFRNTINSSIVWSIIITGLISLLVAFIFAKRISNPIREMNQIARNISSGNLETRVSILPDDEVGELGESINFLAERLKQVDELRKKMTADVAHDLRTPLTTVRSHLEGMIDKVLPASLENLESVLEEVKRLISLVNDLQSIAIADSSTSHYPKKPIDLKEFIADLIKKMHPLFDNKGVILEVEDIPKVTFNSNRELLAKIFDNLLSNALKFTSPGKRVSIKAENTVGKLIIWIKDEGIGIDKKDLPFIFERFYRTDQSRNRESGGFGLGLTIVKELVQALDGNIAVSSQPGIGTEFTVTFIL